MNKTKKYILTLAAVLSGTIHISAANITSEQNAALKRTVDSLTRAIIVLKKGNEPDIVKTRKLMQQTIDSIKDLIPDEEI